MKPIPPGHSEAADSAPIPGRPWWGVQYGNRSRPSIPPQHSVTGFVRSDGAFVAHETWEVRGKVSSVPSADLAAYDAAHPLPHPGYRAGQVWLAGDATIEIDMAVPHGFFCRYGFFRSDDAQHPLTGAFLLHDPLMPSRAPWGPA